jgi:hypothetical protein
MQLRNFFLSTFALIALVFTLSASSLYTLYTPSTASAATNACQISVGLSVPGGTVIPNKSLLILHVATSQGVKVAGYFQADGSKVTHPLTLSSATNTPTGIDVELMSNYLLTLPLGSHSQVYRVSVVLKKGLFCSTRSVLYVTQSA